MGYVMWIGKPNITLRETQQERDAAVNEVSALKTENALLREQITALTRENTRLVYENQRAQERQSNGKTLLIGSSLIRNIGENRIMNTEVVCLRGAKVCDIHRELKENSDNKIIKYGNIILMCGGNNCAASNPDISSIATDFKELIVTAKSIAMQVAVCSIPPRLEPSHAGEAISSLNAALQSLCSDLKVHFANQHDQFHLQNGSVNDGYLADNVHLTLKGSDAMARTIGLKLRPGHTGASVTNPKQFPSLTWRQIKTKAPRSRPSSDQRTDSDTGEYFTRDIDSQFFDKARTKSVRNNGNATGITTGRAPQHKERTPKKFTKAQYHQRGTYTSQNTYNGNRHRGNEQYETTQRCGFCSEPVCIEKNNIAVYLENGEFWSVFQINKSIGDGHCFTYSLCKSYNTQFSDKPTLSGTELLDMIKIETTENYDYYVPYLNDGSFADLIKQMEMYVYDKIYDIRYGDFVPLIAANALKRDIFIITATSDDTHECEPVFSAAQCGERQPVYIHKHEDHYHALVPVITTVRCNNPISKKSHAQQGANLEIYTPCQEEINQNDDLNFTGSLKAFRVSHPKNLITGHLNINSVRSKFVEISDLLTENLIDILFISETTFGWIFPITPVSCNGFQMPPSR